MKVLVRTKDGARFVGDYVSRADDITAFTLDNAVEILPSDLRTIDILTGIPPRNPIPRGRVDLKETWQDVYHLGEGKAEGIDLHQE